MMSDNSREGNRSLKEALWPILRVLSQLGGYFTFRDEAGSQFVIMPADEFRAVRRERATDRQLALPTPPSKPDMQADSGALPIVDESVMEPVTLSDDEIILEAINREMAFQVATEDLSAPVEEAAANDIRIIADDLGLEKDVAEMRPPVRVRFEPIRGDLPPELQE